MAKDLPFFLESTLLVLRIYKPVLNRVDLLCTNINDIKILQTLLHYFELKYTYICVRFPLTSYLKWTY